MKKFFLIYRRKNYLLHKNIGQQIFFFTNMLSRGYPTSCQPSRKMTEIGGGDGGGDGGITERQMEPRCRVQSSLNMYIVFKIPYKIPPRTASHRVEIFSSLAKSIHKVCPVWKRCNILLKGNVINFLPFYCFFGYCCFLSFLLVALPL